MEAKGSGHKIKRLRTINRPKGTVVIGGHDDPGTATAAAESTAEAETAAR